MREKEVKKVQSTGIKFKFHHNFLIFLKKVGEMFNEKCQKVDWPIKIAIDSKIIL